MSGYIQSTRLLALQHQCLRPWSVAVRSGRDVPMEQLEDAYLSRSCGTVAVLPVAMHHPSFREEVPPRWYQALGVLLGQPSFELGSDLIGRLNVKQLCLETPPWMIELVRRKPTHRSRQFSYTFGLHPSLLRGSTCH